jgi:DNA-binding CsgD family transcriptional regulator
MAKSKLTEAIILAWADAHKARTGAWPMSTSGPVAGVPAQTWLGVDEALRCGGRGLPGGDTLARLLRRRRGVGDRRGRPRSVTRTQLRLVLRLRRQGLTLAEVGRRLGVSRQAIHYLLRRAERDAEGGR